MAEPLEGVRSKIAHGFEQLEALDRAASEFRTQHPHTIDTDFDHEADCSMAVLRVATLPTRLGIMLGESIQQFRSALDHLAYHLAVVHQPGSKGPNFPIYTDRDVWTTPVGKKRKSPRDVYLAAFGEGTLTMIERFQPYNAVRPRNDGLAILQRLSNLDKHEAIHAGYTLVGSVTVRPLEPNVAIEPVWAKRPHGPVEDGTPLVCFRVYDLTSGGQMKMEFKIKVEAELFIRFGSPPMTLQMVSQLGDGVARIVDELERSIPALRGRAHGA